MHKPDESQFSLNIITLIQKYFDVVSDVLNNIHLFKLDIPGSETLINVCNQAFSQSLSNPMAIIKCNLDYQLKLMQLSLTIKDHFELIKALHNELFTYYDNLINNVSIADKDKQFLKFFTKQFLHSIAPDNFIHLNNKALSTCINSNFETLIKGLENFRRDIKNSGQFFNIPNVNKLHFNLGQNLAITEGKVVYRNEIMELICYNPNPKTFSIPILIVPPCINKYYVLDLSSENSFVKWLVDNNFQVFLISWVNPKSYEQNFEFADYIKSGILDSAEYIQKSFGYKKINAIGYCIGGTMLSIAMAYAADKDNNPFNSATFLNTMLDFSDPGEISIFIRDEIIDSLGKIAKQKGYLDGIYLYNIFNLLKSKDLIWSAYINNYIEGNLPKAFDILYWNADYVNLPSKMLEYYLENMYTKNLLIKPDKLKVLGSKIDLRKINIPTFWVACKSDHIVPWQQSFKSMHHIGGDKTFCLGASGHVAGIINPPNHNKYCYWTNETSELNTWLDSATSHAGSWWHEYLSWAQKHSGKLKKSINYSNISSLEEAPGSYCRN